MVLVASTGVIGEPLPVERLIAALPAAFKGLSAGGLAQASRAIMTTDTRPKTAVASFRWRGRTVRIAGCAKGAGMIHPRMATMLAVLLTDAALPPGLLKRALGEVSRQSFESISVDGDTSTNDSVFLLASGASGVRVRKGEGSWARFVAALGAVAGALARQIVRDGEGARRTLEIEVEGARDRDSADRVARAIACSPLVKTALAGGDANWGRILAAAGAAGVPFDPAAVRVSIGGVTVARRGAAVRHDRRRVERLFRRPSVKVRVGLGRSAGRARMLTCDLTAGYVRINADYRS
jgi:glutamate N-acetyltransferase/amino-acid N-acetyltransferase